MRAERRHELKENELEHYLGVVRDYLDDHGKRIALIAVVAGTVFVGVTLFFRAQAAEVEGQWSRKSQLSFADATVARTSLETLAALAQGSTDPVFVMSCLLTAGQESLRMSIEAPLPPDRELNDKARDAFEQLLRRFPDNPVAVGAARLGLASVAENDFALDGDVKHKDEAATQIAAVIDDPALDGLPYKRMALDRRKRLDSVFTPVQFAEPTPEEVEEAKALKSGADAATEPSAAAPTTITPTAVAPTPDAPPPADAQPKVDPVDKGGNDAPDEAPSDPGAP